MWRGATAFIGGVILWAGCGSPPAPESAEPRRERTGAVAELTAAELDGHHTETVEEMLRGRVPGLQVLTRPNGDLTFRIRGGPNTLQPVREEPLVVIDGMSISSSDVSRAIRALHPTQIASVRVLRDVASTSIYGSRGANGVILITTKRD
jgi:TonB-dependent starch-binding outer membrane protein SusC